MYPAGIYNNVSSTYAFDQSGVLDPTLRSEAILPGMFVGCFPLNTLLNSTLECLFNMTCLKLLQSAVFDRPPINVMPLTNEALSRFPPTTKIQTILDELLVETWTGKGNYSAFYGQCQPNICTYSYVPRASAAYVLTALVGLFGGLSMVIKMVAPMLVSAFKLMHYKFTQRNVNTVDVSVARKS